MSRSRSWLYSIAGPAVDDFAVTHFTGAGNLGPPGTLGVDYRIVPAERDTPHPAKLLPLWISIAVLALTRSVQDSTVAVRHGAYHLVTHSTSSISAQMTTTRMLRLNAMHTAIQILNHSGTFRSGRALRAKSAAIAAPPTSSRSSAGRGSTPRAPPPPRASGSSRPAG